LINELKQGLKDGNLEDVAGLADDLQQNLETINNHGKRADSIVKGMLEHSKAAIGQKEPTDLNKLANETLQISYKSFCLKDAGFSASIITYFDDGISKIPVIPQSMQKVFLNLFNNAFYAVNEKKNNLGASYSPMVSVTTKKNGSNIQITVSDNGTGISPTIIKKIFHPFFTTKPTGLGTGLGLSLSYDIIKAHGGEISVESAEEGLTEFIIYLPEIVLVPVQNII
jgi:signal transduction histidine kinase